MQQVRHGLMADLVPLPHQLGRQLAGALARPAQRRHRVSPRDRLHQGLQVLDQTGILAGQRLASASWCAHPLHAIRSSRFGLRARRWTGLEFAHADANGGALQPGGIRHRRDPAASEHHRFGGCPQPTPSLIQIRAQRLKLRPDARHIVHSPISARRSLPVNLLFDGSLLELRKVKT